MTKCRCVFYGLNLKHEVMDVISPCLYIYHILCANYPFIVINACMNRKGMLVFELYSTMEHKVKINASKNRKGMTVSNSPPPSLRCRP